MSTDGLELLSTLSYVAKEKRQLQVFSERQQQQGFICAKAKRQQQQGFICAKAKQLSLR
ncbi:hypothetical protein ACQKMI_04505 [Lysinibacillus sp. NPDC097214]|uniref:hypothetical protein n=1 Tax=Lysinibacillus sp. NPDC097214 TaxID=3390584 RepID=UPI003D048C6D